MFVLVRTHTISFQRAWTDRFEFTPMRHLNNDLSSASFFSSFTFHIFGLFLLFQLSRKGFLLHDVELRNKRREKKYMEGWCMS